MTLRSPRAASAGAARRRTIALTARAAALALALTVCTGAPRRDRVPPAETGAPSAAAGRALDRLVADGAPGAASLSTRDGRIRASRFTTAGVADLRTGRPMGRTDHFRAGSLTKTVVATVVLQLAAERKLSLDDTADRHLPRGVPGIGPGERGVLRQVTVRQLLDHTTGLFDYTADPRLARQLRGRGFRAHRYDHHTPAELLRIALSHRPTAAAGPRSHGPAGGRGAPFAYSNTNYLVLGLLIRGVTGHSYAEEIRRRVIGPVGLRDTSFPGTDPDLPEPHGRAYSRAGGRRVDVTALDPSRAGAAGEMVTTLGDLNRFFAALLGGALLPSRQMAQLRSERGTGGAYGLGLYATVLPCGVTVWGHNGDINGSYAQTAGTADGRHLVSYRVNTAPLAVPGHGTDVLTAEFCAPSRRTAGHRAAATRGRTARPGP
ncbi:serine hydrolase domain-containing protein [Streptomyces celluloflavus]|uniref:serine hydrolase domain-containing protein n=1 Tax=Streptomyces celluloflavus TaxID=58344 RepID=UPI003674DCD6